MATLKEIAINRSENLRKLLLEEGTAVSTQQWPSNIEELRNKAPFTKIVLVYTEFNEDAHDRVFKCREMNADEDLLFANLVTGPLTFIGYFALPLNYISKV